MGIFCFLGIHSYKSVKSFSGYGGTEVCRGYECNNCYKRKYKIKNSLLHHLTESKFLNEIFAWVNEKDNQKRKKLLDQLKE